MFDGALMRFLILNTDYPMFLELLYAQNPGLKQAGFDEQMQVRNASLFGVFDAYPRNLRALGHEAWELHINNGPMQMAWARENGVKIGQWWPRPFAPGIWKLPIFAPWWHSLIARQIAHYRPDVLLTHDQIVFTPQGWRDIKKHTRLLFWQVASPYVRDLPIDHFDLILSSLPNYVEQFRKQGVRSELYRLGFDPVVLQALGGANGPRDIDVSFVGSLAADHSGRLAWIETLCRRVPVKIWGQLGKSLPSSSPVWKAYQGPAWGKDMFSVMTRSRITLNYHIGIAGNFANNMRLYEATGTGAMLMTDDKSNIRDMFEPGKEVVCYKNVEECATGIERLLNNEKERQAIAAAGQARTLREHTYLHRMRELVTIVERHLS